ncbi:MAG: D-alanyl-D-alanine carboxypeptidase, partial [Clostridia bacterium]|nr:D-alanyl-D-alanine carboxypeptidase [Clostridia bacterium]
MSFLFFLNFIIPVTAENNGLQTEKTLLTVNTALQVEVHAKACVLMDVNTGTVLSAKNENEKLYPASVTKIMSLLLVCEAIRDGKLSFD